MLNTCMSESKLKSTFSLFDKTKKNYLTKKEFKLSFLYLFGEKISYPFYAKIWKGRLDYNKKDIYNIDNINKGIILDYFINTMSYYIKNLSNNDLCKIEFNAFLNEFEDDFIYKNNFFVNFQKNYPEIDENIINEIFELLDCDDDNRISLNDYIKFKKHININ